jgi:hypothetical protein
MHTKKHDYFLGQVGNAEKIQTFFDTSTNTIIYAKGSESVPVKSNNIKT